MKYYKIIPSECTEVVITHFKDKVLRKVSPIESSHDMVICCTFARYSDYSSSGFRTGYPAMNCRGWWFSLKGLEEVIIT
jgi:hypothetical protein